jgi:hypothetical protein
MFIRHSQATISSSYRSSLEQSISYAMTKTLPVQKTPQHFSGVLSRFLLLPTPEVVRDEASIADM